DLSGAASPAAPVGRALDRARGGGSVSQTSVLPRVDAITLEVARNRLAVIADEMEETLLRSSYSPIVKEGLDASAALFTSHGETLAQSVAIPIHLGTLVPAVRRIIAEFPLDTMHTDDVYLLNDPYDGGTHLPDVIMVV